MVQPITLESKMKDLISDIRESLEGFADDKRIEFAKKSYPTKMHVIACHNRYYWKPQIPIEMDFECKQLTIDDNSDFGCTITFRDTIKTHEEIITIEELLNPSETGKYLLMQRSYAEDEDETDWYTIETSEKKIDFSQKDMMYITLSQKIFKIYCANATIVIALNLTKEEHNRLDKTLRKRFREKVVMLKDEK